VIEGYRSSISALARRARLIKAKAQTVAPPQVVAQETRELVQ